MDTRELLLVLCSIILVTCETSKIDVESTMTELNKMLDAQSSILQQLEETIETLGKRITALEDADEFVGFSAYMVGGNKALEPDDYFPFKGVDSNHGNHYNPKESEFTCPTTGIYYFSVNLYSSAIQDDTDYELSSGILIVGSVTSVSIFSRNLIDSDYITTQGTVNIITKCKKGETAWVVNLHTDNRVYGTPSAKRSTFIGMRVVNLQHEDTDSPVKQKGK